VDQIPFPQEETLKGIRQLPGALLHEGRRGMRGDARNLYAPCGQLHDHEHVVGHQAMPCRHLHGEEIRGGQHFPVELEELRPAHASLAALRRRFHVMTPQDIAYRDRIDGMPQVCQGALDATVTPRVVLLRHAHDQLLDFLGDTRSAQLSSLRAPVKLLGDQSLVPAQEGVRRRKRGDLCEALAPERVGERGEAAALRVCQAQPAATEVALRTRFSSIK